MLLESKLIGPAPCSSPNFVLDYQLNLNDIANSDSISTIYGIKRNKFQKTWEDDIRNEIINQWNSLIPSIKNQWRCYRYTTIIFIILSILIPSIIYIINKFKSTSYVLIGVISSICCLIIGFRCGWYWLYVISDKSTKKFVNEILSNLIIRNISQKYSTFQFTIIYPVIFYLQKNNKNIQKQSYCFIRISEGTVYCDQKLEPILISTSDVIIDINAKNIKKNEWSSTYSGEKSKSITNPPILHQIRKDNKKHYSLLSPLVPHSPIITKVNIDKFKHIQLNDDEPETINS